MEYYFAKLWKKSKTTWNKIKNVKFQTFYRNFLLVLTFLQFYCAFSNCHLQRTPKVWRLCPRLRVYVSEEGANSTRAIICFSRFRSYMIESWRLEHYTTKLGEPRTNFRNFGFFKRKATLTHAIVCWLKCWSSIVRIYYRTNWNVLQNFDFR